MTVQLSVAVRNARLDVIETTIGTSPTVEVRTGAMPANCAASATGTVLATITNPSDWMNAASSGSKTLLGTWQDLLADASGLAGYFRVIGGGNCHIQGLCSQAWAASTAYLLNQQVSNGGNVYRCTTAGTSAGSGGPTGTGSGITDGSAVWTYVGALDMTLDNTNLNAGQPFSISAFTMNEANA